MTDRVPGRWYWVKEVDSDWYPAAHHPLCAGGWTNFDTWEDFDGAVVQWHLIPLPEVDEHGYPLKLGDFYAS